MQKDKIYLGNNLDVLKTFEDNSIDSVVTDPPYGINFMNKKWDYDVPSVELWLEVIRVLKPGGHILCACGTRTQHRMAVNIEDAGFEIRDIVAWIYGSGFPKSFNIANAIEGKLTHGSQNKKDFKKLDGVKGTVSLGYNKNNAIDGFRPNDYNGQETTLKADLNTEEAKQYEGWGTALKPAMELWTLARKPFKSTVADNVLKYGTGGINIDGCRVEAKEGEYDIRHYTNEDCFQNLKPKESKFQVKPQPNGRFPANVILSWPEEEYALKDNISSEAKSKVLEWLNENT